MSAGKPCGSGGSERVHDVAHFGDETRKRMWKRPTLAERYARGEVGVYLHFGARTAWDDLDYREWIAVLHHSGVEVGLPVTRDVSNSVEGHVCVDVSDDFERAFAVLVDTSQSIEDREGRVVRVPSLVRLKALDRVLMHGTQSLDCGAASREEIGLVDEDWKISLSVRGSAQGSSQVVERTAEAVGDFSDNGVEDDRRLAHLEAERKTIGLRVELSGDVIRITPCKESLQLRFQLVEATFGPPDLLSAKFDGVSHAR